MKVFHTQKALTLALKCNGKFTPSIRTPFFFSNLHYYESVQLLLLFYTLWHLAVCGLKASLSLSSIYL